MSRERRARFQPCKYLPAGIFIILFSGMLNAQPLPSTPGGLDPEDEKEAIELLGKLAPMRLKRLKEMRLKNPTKYQHFLRQTMRRKKRLELLKEIAPERYELLKKQQELEVKSWKLAEDYKSVETDAEKEKIKSDLKTLLNELFDLKEKDKEFELQRLEKEIAKIKELITKRKAHKNEIIENHFNRLIGEKEYLEW
ncbi:hypothetical protein KAW65_06270 [candidate division WOR-3 bacterium]|nr:hypothetical protein [candidate division WOR-3 bacterium]